MRTGSIGNRDAETLIKSLAEPKRTILSELRSSLLSLGYTEEAGYDPINVESFICYSFGSGLARFIFKHKWELAVFLVFHSESEKNSALLEHRKLVEKEFENNAEDGTIWVKLDPQAEGQLIQHLARSYAR